MESKKIVEHIRRKMECAILRSIPHDIRITTNIGYRAVAKPHGFHTSIYWDYPRYRNNAVIRSTYVLDLCLIGLTTTTASQSDDLARLFYLPYTNYERYLNNIHYGITGHSYDYANVDNALASSIFDMAIDLRRKYRKRLGS